MNRQRHNRNRILQACFCLAAVLLLHSPLAGAVFSAQAMACCTGDHCPIPEHHHHSSAATPVSHADCDHDMSGLGCCSMACCQNSEKPMATGIAFVLPAPTLVSDVNIAVRAVEAVRAFAIPSFIPPLAPPPRVA